MQRTNFPLGINKSVYSIFYHHSDTGLETTELHVPCLIYNAAFMSRGKNNSHHRVDITDISVFYCKKNNQRKYLFEVKHQFLLLQIWFCALVSPWLSPKGIIMRSNQSKITLNTRFIRWESFQDVPFRYSDRTWTQYERQKAFTQKLIYSIHLIKKEKKQEKGNSTKNKPKHARASLWWSGPHHSSQASWSMLKQRLRYPGKKHIQLHDERTKASNRQFKSFPFAKGIVWHFGKCAHELSYRVRRLA